MSEQLLAWESVRTCKKCGEWRAYPLWTGIVSQFKYEYIPDTSGDTADAAGHMEVVCSRCGHGWGEQTKDAAND